MAFQQSSDEIISSNEDHISLNQDADFSQVKQNIPTATSNPIELVNISGLLSPQSSNEKETISFFDAMKLPANSRTKQILIRTTIAMVTVPLAAFFFSYFVLFTPAEWGGDFYFNDSLIYSGIVSVITVNLIMAFFVYYSMALDPDCDNEDIQSADKAVSSLSIEHKEVSKSLSSDKKLTLRSRKLKKATTSTEILTKSSTLEDVTNPKKTE